MKKKISKSVIERIYKINCKIEMLSNKRNEIIFKERDKKELSYLEFEHEYGKATAGR